MGASTLSSRAIIGRYYQRLEQNPGLQWVTSVSNYFTSDQESETYKWLGQVPAMREWIGGRHAKGFLENGVTIQNKHFEATLEVLVREMQRDKTGQIMVRVSVSTRVFEMRRSEPVTPAEGDSLIIGDDTYIIQGEPLSLDTDRLVWTLDTRPV